MTNAEPKPGPSVSLDDRIATAVADALRGIGASKAPTPPYTNYRDLAKAHAKAASELAQFCDEDNAKGVPFESWTPNSILAALHAQVSIACSHVSPPARHHRTPEPQVRL